MKRRTFVRKAGCGVAGGALFGCQSILEVEPELLPLEGPFRTTGRVQSGGQGVPSVAVSDGFSVSLTDADGLFEIRAPNRPEYVWVSVPAAYAVPSVSDGRAAHFVPYPRDVDSLAVTFDVVPSTHSQYEHSVAFLADVQVELPEDLEMFVKSHLPSVLTSLRAGATRETVVVSAGDMIFDRPALLHSYIAAMASCNLPVFHILGNHDHDPRQPLPRRKDLFRNAFGPPYYSFNIGEVHYVVLDTVQFEDGGFRPGVEQQQLDWLIRDLAVVEAGRTVVALTHVPISWLDSNEHQALRYAFRRHVAHNFAAHTHNSAHFIGDRFSEHHVAAVCGAWWAGPVCADGTPPGFTQIDARGSSVSWTYKTIKDALNPLRVMPAFGSGTDGILVANVWDWDPRWRVFWGEDDEPWRLAALRPGLDPLAQSLYEGPSQPPRRTILEPAYTEHLFAVNPASGWRELHFRVADAFGRVHKVTVPRASIGS